MSKEFESQVLKCFENIDKRFESIDKRFDNIDKRFENMDKRFENMDKRFDKVENTLDRHTKILENHSKILDEHTRQINSLHESVTLIENKVMSEFPALFEAFDLHKQMHQDYDEKNSYLSLKVEEDSMRISVLEDQMKFIKNTASRL